MSVYTPVSQRRIAEVLTHYNLELVSATAASHGIENSTFLIEARQYDGATREVVLTVFEQFDEDELAPYIKVVSDLALARLPVAPALADGKGRTVHQVEGKPAVLMPRLRGEHCLTPQVEHCRQIGHVLSQLHQAPIDDLGRLPNERERLARFMEQSTRLPDAAAHQAAQILKRWKKTPPTGVLVHADLFRDNVLFDGDHLSGVLDFYNACAERPEYDLAVALNDWCVAADGRPVPRREAALLVGYREGGGHYDEEVLALALAVAALRFWLSRLAGPVSADAEGQGSKDPAEFARIFGYRFNALSL